MGNTNDVTLGRAAPWAPDADGRPGTGDEPSLPQLNGPEVEIVGTNSQPARDPRRCGRQRRPSSGLSLHGGGNFAGVGTGSGTIRHRRAGSGALIDRATSSVPARPVYTLPAGAQTQDNLVHDHWWRTNHMIAAEPHGVRRGGGRSSCLSSLIGTVTIQDNEMTGSLDGIDFCEPRLRSHRHSSRSPGTSSIHDSLGQR